MVMDAINKAFVVVFAFLVLITHAVQAQRFPSEAATVQQRLVEDIGTEQLASALSVAEGARHTSILLQNGTSNTARIDQQSLSVMGNQAYVAQVGAANALGLVQTGSGNVTTARQSGTGNQADLTQNGQNNTSALTQKGDNNRLTGLAAGSDIELNIHQNGNNNQVDSEIRQNKQAYTINQYGNGNTLKQLESTIEARPGYTVEMRGSGINITIEQGKVK
jgi:minor curlin subunit